MSPEELHRRVTAFQHEWDAAAKPFTEALIQAKAAAPLMLKATSAGLEFVPAAPTATEQWLRNKMDALRRALLRRHGLESEPT